MSALDSSATGGVAALPLPLPGARFHYDAEVLDSSGDLTIAYGLSDRYLVGTRNDVAWVLDMTDPAAGLTSLGTLGGPKSFAIGVGQRWVVGYSEAADGRDEAFVVDLSDPMRPMQNLGPGFLSPVSEPWAGGQDETGPDAVNLANGTRRDFGGLSGSLNAISGTLAIGSVGYQGAYVDLADPDAPLAIVPTFGGFQSAANGVDGSVIVGAAQTPQSVLRAFAYDVTQPKKGLQRLSIPGALSSTALQVSGRLVAGLGTTDAGGRFFVWALQLGNPAAGVRNLGPGEFDGTWGSMAGTLVVGTDGTYPWVNDAANPAGRNVRLGGGPAHVTAINSFGLVSGYLQDRFISYRHAVMWVPHVVVGSPLSQSAATTVPAGTAWAARAVAYKGGSATKASILLDPSNAASRLTVGLYADGPTGPGKLITTGMLDHPKPGLWNTVMLTPATIPKGAIVWLAVLGPAGGGAAVIRTRIAGTGGPSQLSVQTSLNALPNTWATGSTGRRGPASLFVNFSP